MGRSKGGHTGPSNFICIGLFSWFLTEKVGRDITKGVTKYEIISWTSICTILITAFVVRLRAVKQWSTCPWPGGGCYDLPCTLTNPRALLGCISDAIIDIFVFENL